VNYHKAIAGAFAGAAALLLIYRGYITEGMYIILPMMGFFVGEANGKRMKQ